MSVMSFWCAQPCPAISNLLLENSSRTMSTFICFTSVGLPGVNLPVTYPMVMLNVAGKSIFFKIG